MSARMVLIRPLTPKEFSDALGGLVAPKTVRSWCAAGELPLVRPGPPYFIHASGLEKYRADLTRFLIRE